MPLSLLLNDTAALLSDSNFAFTPKAQLVRWVNEARANCAKRTGCVRRLIAGQSAFGASAQPGYAVPNGAQPGALPDPYSQAGLPANGYVPGAFNQQVFNSNFSTGSGPPLGQINVPGASRNMLQTIPGVERYPYEGFFNPFLRKQHAGTHRIMDVITCAVNSGGAARPVLDWKPWDDMQAYLRSYSNGVQGIPFFWSVYNDGPQGEIWLAPVPSIVAEIELDAYVSPKPLNSDDDFDVIPEGFQEAIKFGAAALSFAASARYAQAQQMENMFADAIGVARVAVDRGKVASYYWSTP